jgi:hypothetical protein
VLFRTGRTLYRVPISGGPAISLSTYTSAVDTTHFDILVADRHVIYQDGSAIFSIPLAGGTPVPLTPPVDQDATLLMNQLSPDSRYVVYTIEDQAQHTRSIYSVPVGGGSPVTLLAGSIATTTLYTISGSYAIGMASRLLYAAPLADGPTSKLSVMPLIIEFSVISADGRHIIYLAHPPADISGSARALYVATLPAAQP